MTSVEYKSSHPSLASDQTEQLSSAISEAVATGQTLNLRGGGSKQFIGLPMGEQTLDTSQHTGIISYEPTELVVTARSGTNLDSLKATLAENGQMLPFEPPSFSASATLGGTIACALSGPARPYYGAARDYVLGCRIINGHAHNLRFGGEVMKNVAGYDITRLMTGSMGTLGLILDTSLKVLPLPEYELTLQRGSTTANALQEMQLLAGLSEPVTASAYIDGTMYIRLSGDHNAVKASAKRLGGDCSEAQELWSGLREHKLPFFQHSNQPLWRISVPPLTPELPLSGTCLYDWAGMQRWLFSNDAPDTIRAAANSAGGHATLFRADESLKKSVGVFHSPSAAIMQLHQKIKHEFDPQGIFNPQRMYPEI